MKIVFDTAKRSLILAERGLDVAGAGPIFGSFHLTRDDAKHSEIEDRYIPSEIGATSRFCWSGPGAA